MIHPAQMAACACADAEASLLAYASDAGLADATTTLPQYRRAYEAVRAELLEAYPDLQGPTIGDLLGEAARAVWPTIYDQL